MLEKCSDGFRQFLLPDQPRLHQFAETLLRASSFVSLTGWKTAEEIWIKGIIGSVYWAYCLNWNLEGKGIDVGSGAGFPGIPLSLVFPGLHIVLVESQQKKCRFLYEMADTLGLNNMEVVCERAEILAHQSAHREGYDWAFTRALGGLPVLNELTLPFLRLRGKACHLKGEEVFGEILSASKSAEILGGQYLFFYSYATPDSSRKETVVVVEKYRETPKKYPRRTGIPQKRPLL